MKGSAKTAHLGLELRQHIGAAEGQVEITDLKAFLHLPLVAELPAWIDAHIVFSAGALLHKIGEALCTLTPNVVRRPHMAEAKRLFSLGESVAPRADEPRGGTDERSGDQ